MNLDFGKNLKKLRLEKGITQETLAQMLGLSVQAVSRYETASAYPDIELLPVIAGFFGTTVDSLLGVSIANAEKRKEEYDDQLRQTRDRKERLEILRRLHAEFPDDWDGVNKMCYEMIFLPECLEEMRTLVNDAMARCSDQLMRENIIIWYLRSEEDEERAQKFVDKFCSNHNMKKQELLYVRYNCRGDADKLRPIAQKRLLDHLKSALTGITQRASDGAEGSIRNAAAVLDFIDHLTDTTDRTQPDLWFEIKMLSMLRLANGYFAAGKQDEGFRTLSCAAELFKNLFSLPDGTILTYHTAQFDCLRAKKQKQVYYSTSEFVSIMADSMMVDLIYENPIAPVNAVTSQRAYDLDGFETDMIFSRHSYDILKNAGWDGFAAVKNDSRYIECLNIFKKYTLLEDTDNLFFLMRTQALRTDEWFADKEQVSALFTDNWSAYMVFDDQDDKIGRMKQEGNTKIRRIATLQKGGQIIQPPASLLQAAADLDPDNGSAEVMVPNAAQGFEFRPLAELLKSRE